MFIDELLQFWNVFKGEMLIVGLCLECLVFVDEFKYKILNYMFCYCVKFGIMGWVQVYGWCGNMLICKCIQYDFYYIENWSLCFDVKIFWMILCQGWFKNVY